MFERFGHGGHQRLVTEFDVDDRDLTVTMAQRAQAVADYARARPAAPI